MKKIMLFLTGTLFIALFMSINKAFAIKDTTKVSTTTTLKTNPPTRTTTTSITVYSDTSGLDDPDSLCNALPNHFQRHHNHQTITQFDAFPYGFNKLINEMTNITGYVLFAVLATIFVLPILLISIVCFFIYRMRREKYRAMQEAYKHGINIPQNPQPPLTSTRSNNQYIEDLHMQKTIKQASIGLGLMLIELFWGFEGILGAIGAFVFCLAGGRLLIYLLVIRKKQGQQTTTSKEEVTIPKEEEYSGPNAESNNTTKAEEEQRNDKENNPSDEASVK